MATIRLDLAYNGARFAGWATQPGERTVQEELERALGQVLGTPARLTVAGRTDAGVHAWGQVASSEIAGDPPETLGRALNAITGDDVAVWSAVPVAGGFDARRDARSRTYCYRLLAAPIQSPFERGLSLLWPHRIYPGLLERCAEALVGRHDFTAFTPTQTEHVRFERDVLSAEWRRGRLLGAGGTPTAGAAGELLEFWIEADAFMRNMVRALVGTMLEVGTGRRELDDFLALLSGAPRERAGDTAHPHGLYLASVSY
ncbi:MAG: tRNA pseudouridine(38-40) synthase TruA [Actinobacteria bacterium]|nr:tRNA pseudouridine(38-40) synthase TruA [Actinomycetota bacterium]